MKNSPTQCKTDWTYQVSTRGSSISSSQHHLVHPSIAQGGHQGRAIIEGLFGWETVNVFPAVCPPLCTLPLPPSYLPTVCPFAYTPRSRRVCALPSPPHGPRRPRCSAATLVPLPCVPRAQPGGRRRPGPQGRRAWPRSWRKATRPRTPPPRSSIRLSGPRCSATGAWACSHSSEARLQMNLENLWSTDPAD